MVGVDVEEVAVFIDPLCQPHFPFVELSRRVEVWGSSGKETEKILHRCLWRELLGWSGFSGSRGSIGVFFGHAIEWK